MEPPVVQSTPVRQGAPLLPQHADLMSVLHEPALLVDAADRIIQDVNASFEALVGRPRGELVGRSARLIHVDEEAYQAFGARLQAGTCDGGTFSVEWPFRRASGERFLARVSVAAARDAHGMVVGYVATLQDLAAQREAEQRAALLAEASRVLAQASLEPEALLRGAARLAAGPLGDYVAVDLFDGEGRLRRVEVAHADPGREADLKAYMARYPPGEAYVALLQELPAGGHLTSNHLTREALCAALRDEGQVAALQRLGLRHALTVPLHGSRGLLGSFGFSRTGDQPYTAADERLALELCSRAAVAYEHARLHAELARQHARLDHIVEATGEAPWDRDLLKGHIWWSPQARRMWGLPFEEEAASYDAWSALVHPDDRPHVERIAREAFESGAATLELEYRLRRPDGSWAIVHDRGRILRDAQGRPVRALGSATDITERRAAERRTRELEARWKSVVESAPDWIYLADAAGRIESINRGADHASIQEIVGTRFDSWFLPAEQPRLRQVYIEALRTGQPATLEAGAEVLGVVRHYELRFGPIMDGKEARGMAVVVRDVTDRREQERALLVQAQVLDSMAEAVIVTDGNGLVSYTNRAADALFGYERGELVGQRVEVLNAYLPEENERKFREIQAALASQGVWEGEIENRRRDGTRLWTYARISQVRLGGRVAWVGVQEDITLKRELAQREAAQARVVRTLHRVQMDLAQELDVEKVVQGATDAGTTLTGAQFGAFFYNVDDGKGGRYTLYTLSGVPRDAFASFPMPRNTAVFAPTFRGDGVVRSDDITKDPRYGQNAPHAGMPKGHLPVRSYLAVPVVSRDGTVHGGMFFGHPDAAVFSPESEELARGIAAQAAIALDNAHLYRAARAAEERLRSIFENAPVQILAVDPQGRIESINHSLMGRPTSAVVGTNVYDTIPASQREDIEPRIRAALEEGTPAEYEVRLDLPSGVTWRQVRIAPLREGTTLRGAIILSQDVTARKRAEQALAEEESRSRFLVDNASDVIGLSTLDGIFRDVSPVSARVLGWAPEELVGRPTLAVVHPDDRERVRAVRAQARESDTPYSVQFKGIRKDGSTPWLEESGRVVVGHDGGSYVFSTIRDVTARKEAERALEESEERFRTLVTATTEMVWNTDAEGQIGDLPEWRAFTGQSVEEVRGAGWLDAVHPEDRDRVSATWLAAFQRRAVYRCEYRVRSRTGEYRHFLARGVPRFGRDGNLVEYIGSWNDVTDEKAARQEAESLRAQLVQGEKLAALGSLVSGVAHEIRTPLTYLGNNLALVESAVARALRDAPPERAREAQARLSERLADANDAIDRISRIVEDLRKYTKLKPASERAVASLTSLAADAIELFRATHRGDVRVLDDLAATHPVRANRVQVQQVLLNLLQNAQEAGPVDAAIRVRTRDAPEGAILEVEDRGAGIPPAVLARIWDPFFTTKTEGTGLGLSIVRRILDDHGARVEVESEPGRGTLFRIVFPRAG